MHKKINKIISYALKQVLKSNSNMACRCKLFKIYEKISNLLAKTFSLAKALPKTKILKGLYSLVTYFVLPRLGF